MMARRVMQTDIWVCLLQDVMLIAVWMYVCMRGVRETEIEFEFGKTRIDETGNFKDGANIELYAKKMRSKHP